jgi:hypothetical protein
MMISAFSHQRGEVLELQVMENKTESEINVVRELIKLLDLSLWIGVNCVITVFPHGRRGKQDYI